MKPQSRRPGGRLPAALAVGACLILQLSGALHHLLVQHQLCAAHGDLSHGDSGSHTHARAQPTGGRAALGAADQAHRDDGHIHCPAAFRDADAAPAATQQTLVLRGASSVQQVAARPSRHAQRVLELAPKTSPPA